MFGRGIPLFRLFDVQVKLDPSWFIVAFLVTISLALSLFPGVVEGLAPAVYWGMGIFGAIGLFASILAHEYGHALVARRRGLPMRGITLFIFGGVAEMTREPDSAQDEFVVAVAGPAVSVAIGVGCLALTFVPLPLPVAAVLSYLGSINLMLVLFNMIPAFPLDGGRVLRSALWAWKDDLRSATRIASLVGGGFGLAMIVFAIFVAFAWGAWIGAMWLFLIGLFLRSAARQSYEQVVVRQTLMGHPVRAFMNDRPLTVPLHTSIADFVEDHVYRHHRKVFPAIDDGELRGCISAERIRDLPRDEWARHEVAEYTEPCGRENTIDADEDAAQALQRMAQHRTSRLMVTQDGRLVGVIALRDLIGHIELRRELEPQGPF